MTQSKSSSSLLKLIELLRNKKLKIAFAESCTGGLLSATFTAIPGVSDVFSGAVVSYANQIKEDLLGVQAVTLKKYGAVSEPVVLEMAKGVLARMHVDCAIAVTGIAGPTGGSVDKPVGTVFLASLGPGFESMEKKIFAGSRFDIQQQSVAYAIDMMLNHIVTASIKD